MNQLQTYQSGKLAIAGQAANQAAASSVFERYRDRRAENTLRRQAGGLALFAEFLASAGVQCGDLATDPAAWGGVTWGLVEAFQQWQLRQGYAVGSVNVRISTVKTYAKLAAKAGTLDRSEYAMIRLVESYRLNEAGKIDEKRTADGLDTRKGHKKADFRVLSQTDVRTLKERPDTAQGRRDRLLICLLFDLGLRCGEVAGLQVSDFNLQTGELRVNRPKVGKVQTHNLVNGSLKAARAYFRNDAPAIGPALRGSRKGGELGAPGMSERAITRRIEYLGATLLGIPGLSAHDGRHTWATHAAKSGTPLHNLIQAGGWASPAMPLRYIEDATIANEGVRLDGHQTRQEGQGGA
jgi:integrase